jgi:hypothetical protein
MIVERYGEKEDHFCDDVHLLKKPVFWKCFTITDKEILNQFWLIKGSFG